MAVGKYRPLTLTPINFSLTEGTSIPAPPDSPPDTPRPPTPGKGPLSSHPTPKSPVFAASEMVLGNGSHHFAAEDQMQPVRTSDAANSSSSTITLSPARRPPSMRKFLGLRPLSSIDSLRSDRPSSPATVLSQSTTASRRKSGNWFGKKKTFNAGSVGTVPEENGRSAANMRAVSQPPPPPLEPKGPPPPALPELKNFGVDEDTLSIGAEDLFKNIK